MTRTVDIAIKGGVVVNGKEMRKADVYIKDGRVDSIEQEKGETVARHVVDAAGKFVLPGIIDAHCHPVYADRIDTLSQSAAHGGITTLIPYIGAVKAWGKTGGLLDAVKDFIEEGQKTSVVDFGIHCTLVHDDIETGASVIPKLVDLGVISFKGFMAFSKRGMKLEDNELMKVMETIAGSGALLGVHAENGTIIDYLEDKFAGQGNLRAGVLSSLSPEPGRGGSRVSHSHSCSNHEVPPLPSSSERPGVSGSRQAIQEMGRT